MACITTAKNKYVILPHTKHKIFIIAKDTKLLIGPKISSTLPICDLSSRNTGALKNGTFSFEHLHTKSSSQEWKNSPSSMKEKLTHSYIKKSLLPAKDVRKNNLDFVAFLCAV